MVNGTNESGKLEVETVAAAHAMGREFNATVDEQETVHYVRELTVSAYFQPFLHPSAAPTPGPTMTPLPTQLPTSSQPTLMPTPSPSDVPTSLPSSVPTALPSSLPTTGPSPLPSAVPTAVPSPVPTTPLPSPVPTARPSPLPTTPVPSPLPTRAAVPGVNITDHELVRAVTEDGLESHFLISLDHEPLGVVHLNFTARGGHLSFVPEHLALDYTNFSFEHKVVVAAIDDKIDEGVGYVDYAITNVTSDDVCYQPELREKVGGCVCV